MSSGHGIDGGVRHAAIPREPSARPARTGFSRILPGDSQGGLVVAKNALVVAGLPERRALDLSIVKAGDCFACFYKQAKIRVLRGVVPRPAGERGRASAVCATAANAWLSADFRIRDVATCLATSSSVKIGFRNAVQVVTKYRCKPDIAHADKALRSIRNHATARLQRAGLKASQSRVSAGPEGLHYFFR